MTTFWIWHDYSTTLWISNFCFQISDHVRSNKRKSKITNLKSQILQLLPARITVRVCTLATARIPINPASRAQTFAILATQNLSRHRQQNLLTNQVVEFNRLAVKDRQIQVFFLQFMLLFGAPTDRGHESFGELRMNRQLDGLQTSAAQAFDLGVQLSAQLNFFPAALNPAANFRRLRQPDVFFVQRQAINVISL